MKLPRDVSGATLVAALRRMGYERVRQRGSHVRITTQECGEHHEVIPLHDPIRAKTLSSILKSIGPASRHRRPGAAAQARLAIAAPSSPREGRGANWQQALQRRSCEFAADARSRIIVMAALAKYARRTARPRSARIGTDRQIFPRRAPVTILNALFCVLRWIPASAFSALGQTPRDEPLGLHGRSVDTVLSRTSDERFNQRAGYPAA